MSSLFLTSRHEKARVHSRSISSTTFGATPQSGFTLLETIVYIALFGILMAGVLVAVYNILEGSDRTIASIGAQEEGVFINRKISWALTGASAITSPSPNTLQITRADLGAQSPLVFTGSGTELTLSRGGGAPLPLNASRFHVENVTFSITPTAGGIPASVEVTYTVDGVPFIYKSYLRN